MLKHKFIFLLLSFCQIQFAWTQTIFEEASNAGLENLSGNEGIAIGDFNNDGWEDIYVSVPSGLNRLCKNMGDGTFQEVAASAGIAIEQPSIASTWGDINNDGYLDLYISTVNSNDYLYLNNGDETFTDITLAAGIFNDKNTKCVNMADVNNDGFLDIYVANFLSENSFFINQGNNTFLNHIFLSGAIDSGPSMGNIFFDYDKDGDLDLYLTHDQLIPNILYQNNGNGTFTDVSQSSGVNSIGYGMGVDVGDIDNDGWLDLYITNLFQNVLHKNNGDGTFQDISQSAGVNDNGMGWGTLFLDYDKDGLMDIYVANQSDFMNPPSPNVLYKNMGNFVFEKVATDETVSNVDGSFGVACFDYNLDGNMDLAVANRETGEHLQLFQNTGHDGNWVGVKLLGVESNRNGIGAKVELVDDAGKIHYQEISAGHGWASQNSNILFFGLGDASSLTSATIHWPSGLVQEVILENVNKNFTITEGLPAIEGIHFDLATSIHNNAFTNGAKIKIFPNPTFGTFHINLEMEKRNDVKIEVFNNLGQVVFEQKIKDVSEGQQDFTIDKNNFFQKNNTSMLLVKISMGEKSWTKKVLSF